MPSLQDLQAMHNKPHSDDHVDSKVIVDNYVNYFKYKAIRIAQSSSTPDMVDNIHRNNPEYKLVQEILAALTVEFPGCNVTLSTWGPLSTRFTDDHELNDHDDPRAEWHEFSVDWSNTISPEQK